MEKPLVSAVVVAYNKAGVLADSIRSVLRQTYRPLEVLVVDDGSTDTTPQVVRSFGDRVRYLRKENGGEGSARNLGIREARAAWVAAVVLPDWRGPVMTCRNGRSLCSAFWSSATKGR